MSARPVRTRGEACLSDLKLDRLIASEFDAGAEREARAHIEGCARCASRLADIESRRAAFLADPPPLAKPLTTPRPNRTATILRWARVTTAAAAPLAMAAAALLWFGTKKPVEEEPATRIKGGAKIGYYVKRGDAVTRGAPGDVVAPGDTIQFTYSADRAGYLAIISVDGARKASVYYPAGPRAAAAEPGKDATLPTSVILDDVLGAETAYGLFCKDPIALEPVRAAFELSPNDPPIPASCEVDKVPFVKKLGR